MIPAEPSKGSCDPSRTLGMPFRPGADGTPYGGRDDRAGLPDSRIISPATVMRLRRRDWTTMMASCHVRTGLDVMARRGLPCRNPVASNGGLLPLPAVDAKIYLGRLR